MVLFPRAAVARAKIHRPADLLWLGDEREVKRHLRPFADAALSFDATAVGLDYGLGDREAKPCAFLPARPGPVYAVEALEDVWQVLFQELNPWGSQVNLGVPSPQIVLADPLP
jgi:hypothetical protein